MTTNLKRLLQNKALYHFLSIVLLFVVGMSVLYWNETLVKRLQIQRGQIPDVVELDPDAPNEAYQGRLIHINGEIKNSGDVVDSEFALRISAVKLKRDVSMYQWQEVKLTHYEKVLLGTANQDISYGYQKNWLSKIVSTDNFHLTNTEEYENPLKLPFESTTLYPPKVTIGKLTVSHTLLNALEGETPLDLRRFDLAHYPWHYELPIHIEETHFYLGSDPDQPSVGDLRVAFSAIAPQRVSCLASLCGERICPFQPENAAPIAVIRLGQWRAEELLPRLQQVNPLLSWLRRASGFFCTMLAVWLIIREFAPLIALPLSVLQAIALDCLWASGIWYQGMSWVTLSSMLVVSLLVYATWRFIFIEPSPLD